MSIAWNGAIPGSVSFTVDSWSMGFACTPAPGTFNWYRDGIFAGTAGNSWPVGSGDQGHVFFAQEQRCNVEAGCSAFVQSNTVSIPAPIPPPPPPNHPPFTCCYVPADGTFSALDLPTVTATYTDPDGDPGTLWFRLFNSAGTLIAGPEPRGVGQSMNGFFTVPSHLSCETPYSWTVEAIDSHNASSGQSAPIHYLVECPPVAPTQPTPAVGAVLATTAVVLSVPPTTDAENNPIYYEFQVFKDAALTQPVVDSGRLQGTTSYAVPNGLLADGTQYFWRVLAGDFGAGTWNASASATWNFSINLVKLGARDYWPVWSHGPVAVNESNGNLIVTAPAPSYPAAALSLALSLAYNSRGSVDQGLGAGWTVAGGSTSASPPAQLIDHNFLSDPNKHFDALERVNADGSSDFYTHVAGSDTYLSPPGDLSRLSKTPTGGGWSVVDPDGSIYTFGPLAADASYPLQNAEVVAATAGQETLTYSYSGTKLSQIVDSATGRTLSLGWNSVSPASCPDAILCVKLCPDTACVTPLGPVWKYVGDVLGGTSGRLVSVSDGVRSIAQFGYESLTSNRIVKVQNAADLDPGHPTVHAVTVAYGANGVNGVTDGPISGQVTAAGGASAPNSTWSFIYQSPCAAVLDPPTAAHQSGRSAAAGCTLMTPPRQQQTGKVVRTFFDNLGRTIETVDIFGKHSLAQWTANNQLQWTEDQLANPTDFSYDPVNQVLTQVQHPPLGSGGPAGRPTTTYHYDEQTISGNPLTGLQGWYYPNTNLSGRPAIRETDPNVAFHWPAGGGPAGLDMTNGFSVRWSGQLNVLAGGGSFTFSTVTDGTGQPTRLTIDGGSPGSPAYVLAIDNWSNAATTASSQPIQLSAGPHRIVLEYAKAGTVNGVELRWSCSSCAPPIATAAIPGSALVPAWLNRTSVVDPVGRISFSHFAKPATGEPDYALNTVTDPTNPNLVTSYLYDSYGRLAQKVLPNGNKSRLIDGTTGSLGGTPNPGYATTYTYYTATDTATTPAVCGSPATVRQSGLLKSRSEPGLADINLVYDAIGRLVASTNGKGTTATCYDLENRMLTQQAPGGAQTTYTYNAAGAPLKVSDPGGTISNAYDEAGRLTDTTDSYGAEAGLVYDPEGNTVSRTTATAALSSSAPKYVTTSVYDDGDRPISLTDPTGTRTYSFYYDDRSLLHAIQYPNNSFSWRDHNNDGWLVGLYNRAGNLPTPLPTGVPPGASIADFTYTYNLDGKQNTQARTAAAGADTNNTPVNDTTSYGYDNHGRLATVTLPGGGSRTYCFDPDSNRAEITGSATTACGGASPTVGYSYLQTQAPGVDQLSSSTQAGTTTSYGYTATAT